MLERHGQVPPRSAMPGTPARQSESKGNSIPGSAYSTPVGGMFGPGGGRGLEHLTPAQRSALMKSQQKGQQNPLLNTGMLASNQKQNVMGKQAPLNRKLFPAPPGPVPPLPSMPNVPNPPPMGMTFDGNMDINSMTREFSLFLNTIA